MDSVGDTAPRRAGLFGLAVSILVVDPAAVPAQEADAAVTRVRLYRLMDATDLRGEQIRLRVSLRSGDSTGGSGVEGTGLPDQPCGRIGP